MSGILTVCDANICRSAAAEFLLADEFSRHSPLVGIEVSSRGATALPDHPACRLVTELRDDEPWLKRARAHRSAQLDDEAIAAADLILTASTRTRSAVVSLEPGARRRVFTMREALWLASGYRPSAGVVGDELVRDLVSHLDAQRGMQRVPIRRGLPWRRAEDPLDIADGHGAGRRAHIATVQQVQSVVKDLVRLMVQDPTLPFLSTQDAPIE